MEIKLKKLNKHSLFLLGVALKGLNGATEIISGILVFFINKEALYRLVFKITQNELTEDKGDIVAGYLLRLADNYSISTQHYVSFYLLIHGIVKMFLVAGLLKSKYCAYPVSIAVFILFIAYQTYMLTLTFSIWLLALTVLDIAIIWLIWIEYRAVRGRSKILS